MFHRKPRRFRRRSNGRGRTQHGHVNGHLQTRLRSNSFSNDQARNNFRPTQSAEKLLEKYNALAKEALSFGDKTSSENFLQHADHFIRIIEDKNRNRNQDRIKVNAIEKSAANDNTQTENTDIKETTVIKIKE